MTQVGTENPLAEQVSAVIPLLKEYTKKIHGMIELAHQFREQALRSVRATEENRVKVEFNVLQQLFNRLRPPMTRLAQHVSAMVEHGKMDEVERLELRPRLAEFEHALLSADRVLAANNPTAV